MEADISLSYPSAALAKAMVAAIRPDNRMPGAGSRMSVTTQGRRIQVRIRSCRKIETLEATVQDLFRCIRAAESSLSAIARQR